jgi:hypothetical protein
MRLERNLAVGPQGRRDSQTICSPRRRWSEEPIHCSSNGTLRVGPCVGACSSLSRPAHRRQPVCCGSGTCSTRSCASFQYGPTTYAWNKRLRW